MRSPPEVGRRVSTVQIGIRVCEMIVLEKLCEVSQSVGSVARTDAVAEQRRGWVGGSLYVATGNTPLSKAQVSQGQEKGRLTHTLVFYRDFRRKAIRCFTLTGCNSRRCSSLGMTPGS